MGEDHPNTKHRKLSICTGREACPTRWKCSADVARGGKGTHGAEAMRWQSHTSEVACPQIITTSQHAAQVTNADVTSICGRRDVQSRRVSPDLSPDLSRWCRSFMSGHRSDICPQNETHTSQVCSGATIAETNRESESIPAALV